MTVLLIAVAVWFFVLTVWVLLKLRQPRLDYPTPPEVSADDAGSGSTEAA